MTVTDLDLLEAIRAAVAGVPGVRLARLVQPHEDVEVPLSRLPAALVAPDEAEILTWPDVPVGAYRLLHWSVKVLDRAVPGTRAFEALGDLMGNCREALSADPTLGGGVSDGPPSKRADALRPAAGGMRLGDIYFAKYVPGRPREWLLAGASGRWTDTPAGAAAFDDESLFSSGPHFVEAGSPARRIKDQAFNGLAGGVALDLGPGPREIRQAGVLSAASAEDLAVLEAAVESFIDGRTYTLTTPDDVDYPHCRLERFERLGPPLEGAGRHRPYRITYRQLSR